MVEEAEVFLRSALARAEEKIKEDEREIEQLPLFFINLAYDLWCIF
ncbi:TPA: hypothetical protein K8250_003436 [Escherichia coli]|nr:hypothetical protein [Escherichia coli]EFE4632309.1 hypothetical protein [Escherichia coli]EFJ2237487.1 hypothetical protein [Escherichia coli]EFK5227244.1 hypothetical protein [Escherichia coli]EFM2123538.1 hypothetical protein [Escherichia coli]EFM2142235.1 hypothetical protein [Escherichia coli]